MENLKFAVKQYLDISTKYREEKREMRRKIFYAFLNSLKVKEFALSIIFLGLALLIRSFDAEISGVLFLFGIMTLGYSIFDKGEKNK